MRSAPVAVLLACLLAVPTVTACRYQPSSSGAKGTVVKRDVKDRWKCHITGRCKDYWITVREDGGHTDRGQVSETVFHRCQIGDRWPACKTAR